MSYIITVLSGAKQTNGAQANDGPLRAVGEAAYQLQEAGADPFQVLGPAAVSYQSSSEHVELINTIRNQLPVDILVQPSATYGRKKLLLADMDSTIVTSETLDDLAALVGVGEQVAAITARAMNGELDFIQALEERVALLTGQPASVLEQAWEEIIYTDGAKNLVQTMRANGARCVLVSGGFHFFADRVIEQIGFHRAVANTLLVENEQLTGTVSYPIQDRQTKLRVLREEASALNILLSETLTVGDGANDLAMLTAASDAGGLGIAYHAKPVVQESAQFCLNHTDLTGLLYAQGYKEGDFIQ